MSADREKKLERLLGRALAVAALMDRNRPPGIDVMHAGRRAELAKVRKEAQRLGVKP